MREPLNFMTTLAFLSGAPVLFAQAMGAGGISGNIVFIGLIFAIMYFVMIRPQQKQAKETQAMLSALKKGDDIVTSSGILGKIHAIDEKVVTIEVGSGLKMRMLKSSIQARVTVEPPKSESDKKADEPKKEEK
jgi:preprotein translocase subunit YajC